MFFFPQQALCWHSLVPFLKGCCYKDWQKFNSNVKQRDLKRNKKKSERRKGWFSVWSSYRVVRDLRYLRETAPFYTTVGTCFVQRMEEPRLSLSILQWGCILTTNTFVLVFFSSWNMLACRKIFSGKQHRWLLSQQSWMGIYCIAE